MSLKRSALFCLLWCCSFAAVSLPDQLQLGMNGVPVVDQGWEWGSCITSAVTAGLDAYHGWRGPDRISATCFIELTRSLPTVTAQTWWDDGDAMQALLLLNRYGVWSIAEQRSIADHGRPACGGLAAYPFTRGSSEFAHAPSVRDLQAFSAMEDEQRKRDGGMGAAMTIPEYTHYAHRSITRDDWHLISNGNDVSPQQLITAIKQAINNGDRVVVGLFFDRYLDDRGALLGACAKHKSANDTWALNAAINHDIDAGRELSGHAVLLTGYDNKACVDKQCGLFTVRNSIGAAMGDHGDYYISYDYIRAGLTYGAVIAIGPMQHTAS